MNKRDIVNAIYWGRIMLKEYSKDSIGYKTIKDFIKIANKNLKNDKRTKTKNN